MRTYKEIVKNYILIFIKIERNRDEEQNAVSIEREL